MDRGVKSVVIPIYFWNVPWSVDLIAVTMSQYTVAHVQGDPVSTSNDLVHHDELFPDDAYADNVYWADLPRQERITWVNNQSNGEAARELKFLAFDAILSNPLSISSLRFGINSVPTLLPSCSPPRFIQRQSVRPLTVACGKLGALVPTVVYN